MYSSHQRQQRPVFLPQFASSMTDKMSPTSILSLMFLVILGFGLRLHMLDSHSLWRDELFSIYVTSSPFEVMLGFLIFDRVHPPLYYFLLFPWLKLGQSEFILRLFSLFWGVLTIPAMYRLGKLIGGSLVGVISAFLLAVSPIHIWFSQEGRMHTLLIFSVLASCLFLLQLVRNDSRKSWIGYFVCTLVALYTHYFAILVLVAQFVALFICRNSLGPIWKRFLQQVVMLSILFFAWVALLLLSGGFAGLAEANIDWIDPVHWYEPFLTFFIFSSGFGTDLLSIQSYLNTMVFLLAILGTLWTHFFRKQNLTQPTAHLKFKNMRLNKYLLWLWLLVPWGITWIVSLDTFPFIYRSVYMDRNLVVVLPALFVLVACGMAYFLHRRRIILLLLLVTLGLTNSLTLVSVYHNPTHSRENWRAAFHHIQSQYRETDTLLLPTGSLLAWWYYGVDKPYQLLPEEFDEAALSELVSEFQEESTRFWLISFLGNRNPHGFPAQRNQLIARMSEEDPFAVWLSANYRLADEWTFTGVRVGLYALDR